MESLLKARDNSDMGSSNRLSHKTSLIVIVFLALGVYNALEVLVKILRTFRAYRSAYFWALIAASLGIVLHAFGYFFRNFDVINSLALEIFLVGPGGMCMITGQSIVLYSRLHLISRANSKDRWLLIMIVIDLLIIQVGATTLYAGSQASNAAKYLPIYKIWERIQVTAFFAQECIISSLYIYRTWVLQKTAAAFRGRDGRQLLHHLVAVNLLVIALDVTILAFQFAGLYDIQTSWKTLAYSIKLKFEFYILNRLVEITKNGLSSSRPSDLMTNRGPNTGTKAITSVAETHPRFGTSSYARMGDSDDIVLKDVGRVTKTSEVIVEDEITG